MPTEHDCGVDRFFHGKCLCVSVATLSICKRAFKISWEEIVLIFLPGLKRIESRWSILLDPIDTNEFHCGSRFETYDENYDSLRHELKSNKQAVSSRNFVAIGLLPKSMAQTIHKKVDCWVKTIRRAPRIKTSPKWSQHPANQSRSKKIQMQWPMQHNVDVDASQVDLFLNQGFDGKIHGFSIKTSIPCAYQKPFIE